MDKYDLLAIVAPIAAPAAPATLLVNILYADMIAEHISNGFAITGAVLSGVGAEASGMIAAYVGIQAFRKKKYGLMVAAALAFIAYAVFMAVGISVSKNPLTMVSTIVISIIAYISVAALADLRSSGKEVAESINQQIAVLDAEANLEDAKRKGINSQTRKLKAEIHVDATVDKTGKFPKITDDKIAEIHQYWLSNPKATLRDVGTELQVSPMTAGKYKPKEIL